MKPVLHQRGPAPSGVLRSLAGALTGGDQMLGQHLGEQLVVAIAIRGGRRLVDDSRATGAPRSLGATHGIAGVHQQVEVGPHGVLMQSHVLCHLAYTQWPGA